MPKLFFRPVDPGTLARLSRDRPDRAGGYWSGVPHDDLLRELLARLGKAGVAPRADPRCYLWGRGRDFAADIPCRDGDGEPLLLTLVNSNARTTATRLYGGPGLPDGSSAVLSEYKLGKHTSRVVADLGRRLDALVPRLRRDVARGWPQVAACLRERDLAGPDAASVLADAAGAGVLTWVRVGRVLKAFGEAGDAWTLYGLAAAELADVHPGKRPGKLLKLARLLLYHNLDRP